jgi:hypothetical protein
VIVKSYKYRLYPSKAQQDQLEQTLETYRHWNKACLAERRDAYAAEKQIVEKFSQFRKVKVKKRSNPYIALGSGVSSIFSADQARRNTRLSALHWPQPL